MDPLETASLSLAEEQPAPRGPVAGHALFRHAFVPALLGLSVASWVFRAEAEQHLKAWRLGVDLGTAALLGSMLLVWLAEQVYPANAEWNYNVASDPARGINRFSRDFFYLTLVSVLSALLVHATSGYVKGAVGSSSLALWPSAAPYPIRVLLAFFGVELLSYWFHRAAHRFELLWRFHSTHHVITELTGLKAIRTHPVDNALFYVARNVPLMLLGAGADELVAASYFGSTLGILAHANIAVSEGVLGLVVNFPRYHAVHHSAEIAESKSNFGCHTVLWDRVFRTFRGAPSEGMVIGVEPVGPRSVWQELGWPFYRSPSSQD